MSNRVVKAITTFMSGLSEEERRRRKREGIIIIVLILVVAALTFTETRVVQFGTDIPVSNAILMFILININLLLLILLIFLVFRNLVKLFYDRKQNVMGARLRTRLVVAFISLTLVPAIVLFFFAMGFITTSIKFWFNVPVDQALAHSLKVGKSIYKLIENNNNFFLERASYQLHKQSLLAPDRREELTRYIQVVQREFNLDAVEVYSLRGKRLAYAVSQNLEADRLAVIPGDALKQEVPEKGHILSASRHTPAGELVSSIASVPFGVNRTEAEALLAISRLLPPKLSSDLTAIARGYKEYHQIKLLQEPIQISYLLSLTIVGLLVVFCAVWFGFYIAKSLTTPIMELAEGLKKVAAGDLNYTIERLADDEIGELVSSFNKMTNDLRTGRKQIEASTAMLARQRDEIEGRRLYMETVLDNISTGVVSLNANGIITTINKSAERMLSIPQEGILNRHFANVLSGRYLQLARDCVERITGQGENTLVFPMRLTIAGQTRSFMMYLNALRQDRANQYMGMVLVVDDLTELERAQRMAAWREVARRIAHEVKNPLTPISLSAQRLKKKFATVANDKIFDECIRTILDYVDIIRNLVNEFSAYAKFPTAKPAPCDLLTIIRETTALYTDNDSELRFTINSPETAPPVNLDRRQIKQALINLIDNAIAAMKGVGDIIITTTFDNLAGMVRMEFADTGEGIPDEEKVNMFEPYFSTKKSGMGLGLAIVNSIITDHGGKISVQDNDPVGTKFIIELPL
jgi:two-component system nitrogen regulation sensor histidine kinase NtrY